MASSLPVSALGEIQVPAATPFPFCVSPQTATVALFDASSVRCDSVRGSITYTAVRGATAVAAGESVATDAIVLNQNVRSNSVILAGLSSYTVTAATTPIITVTSVANGQFTLRLSNESATTLPIANTHVVWFVVVA